MVSVVGVVGLNGDIGFAPSVERREDIYLCPQALHIPRVQTPGVAPPEGPHQPSTQQDGLGRGGGGGLQHAWAEKF